MAEWEVITNIQGQRVTRKFSKTTGELIDQVSEGHSPSPVNNARFNYTDWMNHGNMMSKAHPASYQDMMRNEVEVTKMMASTPQPQESQYSSFYQVNTDERGSPVEEADQYLAKVDAGLPLEIRLEQIEQERPKLPGFGNDEEEVIEDIPITPGTELSEDYMPFGELGWGTSYKAFLDQMGVSDPAAYQHVYRKGLASNPLHRTIQTVFLLNKDYDIVKSDPLMRDDVFADPRHTPRFPTDKNAYWEFFENYKPLKGKELIHRIDQVVDALKAPTGSFSYSPPLREGEYGPAGDFGKMLWKQRFGTSANADQHQQMLAAMPILEHTSPSLRNEISGVLSSIHSQWLTSPNRRRGQNWIEFVSENNYFGFVPKDVLQPDIDTSGSIYRQR